MKKQKRRYSYTTKRLSNLDITDYLNLLSNVREKNKKDNNVTYEARCPLNHNHANGDRNPSFIISKGNKQNVVYTCLSQGGPKGKCNQEALTNWFVTKFRENKILQSFFPVGYQWHKKHGRLHHG